MSAGSEETALDSLLAYAEGYAEFSMRTLGRVPPSLLAVSPNGSFHFIPANLKDVRAKDNFANTARLICLAYGVTAAVIVLEAWMKTAKPGETLDSTEPPSEAFDRQEVVLLTGEASVSRSKNCCRLSERMPVVSSASASTTAPSSTTTRAGLRRSSRPRSQQPNTKNWQKQCWRPWESPRRLCEANLSGTEREGHQLFPPSDLWKELVSAPKGFTEKTVLFKDALGLPSRIHLHTTKDQPVLQYGVTDSTNFLGRPGKDSWLWAFMPRAPFRN